MSAEWMRLSNSEYQRVISSIAGLATAALVLPLFFLRDIAGVKSGVALAGHLTPSVYWSWGLLLTSVFSCICYQYLSAKWIKSSLGARTVLAARTIEVLLDATFWLAAGAFLSGLGCLLYFAVTLQAAAPEVATAVNTQGPAMARANIPPNELLLLERIAKNTEGTSNLWVAAIAGGAAVLGALVSALAGYLGMAKSAESQGKVERAKLQATIVTSERLRWLQDLRVKFGSFFTHIEQQLDLLSRLEGPEGEKAYQQALDTMSKQAAADGNSILLVLDKDKDGQRELYWAINEWLRYMNEQFQKRSAGPVPRDLKHCAKLKTDAFDALREIGRKAWGKVQSLE